MAFLPLFPFLLPLVGIVLTSILPSGGVFLRVRRWVNIAVLVATCILLLLTLTRQGQPVELPAWELYALRPVGLVFSADPLALELALLLCGSLTLVGISLVARGMERFEATTLFLLASGIGVCLASNLLTLCLMWTLQSLALLILDIMRVPDESIPHTIRSALSNLISTTALVLVMVLVAAEQSEVPLADLALSGMPLKLVMLAAIARLSIYPLPGSLKRRWETYLASLCTGGYLWLRCISLSPEALPGAERLVPFGQVALLATALLAALSSDFGMALPYMLSNGLTIVFLAPLLNNVAGFPVVFMVLINLGLCLALIRVDVQVRFMPPIGRWARAPLLIGLASLAGWPLTLGFASHWAFLRLGWEVAPRGFILWTGVAYILAGVSVWQRLRQVMREVKEATIPRWAVAVAISCAALLAVCLVALGFHPALFGQRGLGLFKEFGLPTWGALFKGSAEMLIGLTLIAGIIPPLASWALQRLIGAMSGRLARGFDLIIAVLELDWLYASLERILTRLRGLAERALMAAEETFYLSWTLLWGLIIVLYLVGR